jgi:hypothetical protein
VGAGAGLTGSGSGSNTGTAWVGAASCGQLAVELLDPLPQIGVLFDEPRQLVLH